MSAECRLSVSEQRALLDLCDSFPPELTNRVTYLNAMEKGARQIVVLLERPELKKRQYEKIVDKSYKNPTMRESITSKVMTISYSRPTKQVAYGKEDKSREGDVRSGSDIVEALNSWLVEGFRLKGGSNNLGFLFFYEILSGALPIKILPTDNPAMLVYFLIHTMPRSDTCTESVMMSALRILTNNPKILTQPNLPMYEDTRKFKISIIFAKQGSFENFMKALVQFLTEQDRNIRWPNVSPLTRRQEEALQPLVPGPAAREEHIQRGWFTIEIPDYNCAARTLVPGLMGSKEDVAAFSSIPLLPLGLQQWVEVVPRLKGSGEGDKISNSLNFNVTQHKYAASYVGRSILRRLENDVGKHAQFEREAMEGRLKELSSSAIQAIVRNPSGAEVRRAIDSVRSLLNALIALRDQDRETFEQAIERAVTMSNDVGTPNDERSAWARSLFLLSRYGGRESSMSFDYLVASLLSVNSERDMFKMNPFLNEAAIVAVHDLTISAIMHTSRVAQVDIM